MSISYIRNGLVLGLLALAGCGGPTPPSVEVAPQAEERIRAGDLIRLEIWREDDMSGEYPVDRTGHVVLPMVGKWDVSGDTEATLEARLVRELRDGLRNPSIEVAVLRRVQILGAVRTPGLYPVDGTIRLGEAIAVAGGVSTSGQRNRVYVIRDGERFMARPESHRHEAELPIRSGDVLFVPERNWFLRNYGVLVTAFTTAVGIATLIFTS